MNPFGHTFDSTTTTEFYSDLGENELDVIGRQMNTFLKQITYPVKGDTIMMESLTDEEVDFMMLLLEDYRESEKEDKILYTEILTADEYDALDDYLRTYRRQKEERAEAQSPELPGQMSMHD